MHNQEKGPFTFQSLFADWSSGARQIYGCIKCLKQDMHVVLSVYSFKLSCAPHSPLHWIIFCLHLFCLTGTSVLSVKWLHNISNAIIYVLCTYCCIQNFIWMIDWLPNTYSLMNVYFTAVHCNFTAVTISESQMVLLYNEQLGKTGKHYTFIAGSSSFCC